MPLVFGVYFREVRAPSHARWQGAIYAAGFRVALVHTVVAEHDGMLPAKTSGAEYTSGFLFRIERLLTGMDRLESLLQGRRFLPMRDEPFLAGLDRFAHFRCNAREWPVAVCAAAGFAKACGGVFEGPYGDIFPDIGEVVAYARRESGAPA